MSASPQTSDSVQYISPETVVRAIRALIATGISRRARPSLLGYLVLKAREASPGASIEVRSSGPGSLKPELDSFFGLAPERHLPYVNPFGVREGRPHWLTGGMERWGLYTWLYPGRPL